MKSPFPGMDPYLETRWGDVHTSLVTYARDQVQPQMPRALHVPVEEHIGLAEALVVPLAVEPQTQRSLRIIDTQSSNGVGRSGPPVDISYR